MRTMMAMLCGVFLLAGTTFSTAAPPKYEPTTRDAAKQQFIADITFTGPKDGKPVVLAQPKLIATYGQEAKFLSGGEVPVDLGDGGGGEPERRRSGFRFGSRSTSSHRTACASSSTSATATSTPRRTRTVS